MKKILMFLLGVILVLGCARVRVEAPKEAIKLDISMRLDIYQHVLRDIDDIEDIVAGGKKESKPADKRSYLGYFISSAYAQEDAGTGIEGAALRRQDRYENVILALRKGVIGENKSGLLEIVDTLAIGKALKELVESENADRMVIYEALAKKNNVSVEEIQKLYAARLQKDAPAGTYIKVLNPETGNYEWQKK